MKTAQKKSTRPKARPSKAFQGVNSRAEALKKFEDADLLGDPNFAGEIYDFVISTGMTPAGDFMPPVKNQKTSNRPMPTSSEKYMDKSEKYMDKTVKKAATGNYRAPSIAMKEAQQRYEGDVTRRASGGMVTGYKNGGCVMSGRGGKYKGMK